MSPCLLPRRPLTVALALAVATGCAAAPGAVAKEAPAKASAKAKRLSASSGKPFRLTLLHANDMESKLLTGDSTAGYGGAARFQTVLERLRAEEQADTDKAIRRGQKRRGSILVSSGDNFLAGINHTASVQNGTPWYESIAFKRNRFDAATIGNHEFDFGPEQLADFLVGTGSTPFLSANIGFWPEPSLRLPILRGKIADSTIIRRDGDEIGVIGLTTPDIAKISSPGDVRISSELAAIANREALQLSRRGVNKIILSSHLQGIANEQALIPQLRNIDLVIAGGGDELLANADDVLVPNAGTPAGPYPLQVADATGTVIPVVTTPGELRYVGRLTVEFNGRGAVTSINDAKSGLVRVSGVETDPDYAAKDQYLVSKVEGPLEQFRAALDSNIVATSDVALDSRNPNPIRTRESNVGDLVADAYLHASSRYAAANPGAPVADIAIANGGGIRNNAIIPAGPISEGDTFDILPFSNFVVTVPSVPREQVKELLENGYNALPAAAGRFAQIAGISVVVDTAQIGQVVDNAGNVTTAGARVREATLADGTPIVVNGAVVPGPALNVATVDFLAGGGDFYPFRGLPSVSTATAYQEALANYLTGAPATGGLGGTVSSAQYPDGGAGRITILP